MNIKKIKAQTFEILDTLTSIGSYKTTSDLTKDLSLSSLDMVMLLIMIEDTFNIELDESDMDPFVLNTVDDILNLIKKYLKVKKPNESKTSKERKEK